MRRGEDIPESCRRISLLLLTVWHWHRYQLHSVDDGKTREQRPIYSGLASPDCRPGCCIAYGSLCSLIPELMQPECQ